MMSSKITVMIIVAVMVFLAASVVAKSTTQEDQEYAALVQDSEVINSVLYSHFVIHPTELINLGDNIQLGAVPEDGSVETALLN